MALRHYVDCGDVVPVGDVDLVGVKRMKAPVAIEFRRGAEMRVIVQQVAAEQSVNLEAAVGAGKSTVFPPALAAFTKRLVFHVVPNRLLSLDLFNYLSKCRSDGAELGPPLELWQDGEDQQVPRSGVLMISSAALIALVLRQPNAVKDTTIYLDEAHESDACTHLIRTLSLMWGAARLVQASATFSASGGRPRETPGTIEYKSYDPDLSPDLWDIHDSGKPWYYGDVACSILIFIDSRSQSARLKREYESVGFLAYRLEARMSDGEFIEAMRALRDKKGPLVVLLADYSFRSGFTFDVSKVIDTGLVSYYDATPGTVRKLTRPMCRFESEQAAGRASRVSRGKVRYFSPAYDYPYAICDLEGTEREAAAYLSRCLGFRPTGPLAGTIMACENLPDGVRLGSAITSSYPLTYHVMDSKGRPRTPERSPTPELCEDSGRTSRASQCDVDGIAEPKFIGDEEYVKYLESVGQFEHSPLHCGTYYRVLGVTTKEPASMYFPEGLRSLCKFVDSPSGHIKVGGLPGRDRKSAISLVVSRYNLLNVEVDAMGLALQEVAGKGHSRNPILKREVVRMFEQLAENRAERSHLLGVLDVLTKGEYAVVEFTGMDALIERRKQELQDSLLSVDDKHQEQDEFVSDMMSAHKEAVGVRRLTYDDERTRHSKDRGRRKEVEWVKFTLPPTSIFSKPKRVALGREECASTGDVKWLVRRKPN